MLAAPVLGPVLDTLLLVGVVVAFVIVPLTLALRRRRRNVWRRFARKHGFEARARGDAPSVVGTVDGRPFRLRASDTGSDHEELGIHALELRLGLHGDVPTDLHVRRSNGLIGKAAHTLAEDAVSTGDESFDAETLVTAASAENARAWLSRARRSALLDLIRISDAQDAGVDRGDVFVAERTAVPESGQLEHLLAALRSIAPRLDAVDDRVGRTSP